MSAVDVPARNIELTDGSIRRLAAAIVDRMILEAAYRGEDTSAAEISAVIVADPHGETANYFRRAAADSLDFVAAFRTHPDLMDCFPPGAQP